MFKKLWLVGCLGLMSLASQAQQVFTPQECEAFVQRYFAEKAATASSRSNAVPPLEKYAVSPQRYAAIFRAELSGQYIDLTANEKALVNEIAERNAALATARKTRIAKADDESILTADQYQAILAKYQSEIKFQRSLKPYFDNYLQNQKGR